MSYIATDWDTYDYTNCDNQFNWAKEQNAVFRLHTLIWTNVQDYNNPSFIRESTDLVRKEEFMTEYISNVLSHYYDSAIYTIDVVNEIIDSDGNYRQDQPWYGIDDFMCKAFKAAKASAHPDSKLYYNDYNIEAMTGWQQTRSDAAYNMIKEMTDRGYDDCPIDGIGFQGHINTEYSDSMLDSIHDNFQRYAALGLKV